MINLNLIDREAMYDADDASELLGVHRTTIHRQVFPNVPTVKVGKRVLTKGRHLYKYLSGAAEQSAK